MCMLEWLLSNFCNVYLLVKQRRSRWSPVPLWGCHFLSKNHCVSAVRKALKLIQIDPSKLLRTTFIKELPQLHKVDNQCRHNQDARQMEKFSTHMQHPNSKEWTSSFLFTTGINKYAYIQATSPTSATAALSFAYVSSLEPEALFTVQRVWRALSFVCISQHGSWQFFLHCRHTYASEVSPPSPRLSESGIPHLDPYSDAPTTLA